MSLRRLLILAIILAATAIALPSFRPTAQLHAQDDDTCTPFLNEALQVVGTACAEMGRNEACYGHYPITVEFQPNVNAQFDSDGDLIGIVDLESLVTNPANPETGDWGIALMLVQADLPEDTEATMTFVLFGDVEVTSAGEVAIQPPMCSVANTGTTNINIRSNASTDSEIAGTFLAGEEATANGRNAASDWLRIEQNATIGWVFSDLVALDCDTQTLAIVSDTSTQPISAPMQAITLTSGQNETCQSAPDGLLIRSPEGRRARVVVNGVEMVFSSAGFLTAQASGDMIVQGLEGEIGVTSDGVTETILPDTFTAVPLDANLAPTGPPDRPQTVPASSITTTLNSSLDMLYDTEIGIETCQATATTAINTRTGPGTDYPQSVGMPAGQERTILGKATDDDGSLWWKFGLTWVRSDLVSTIGDCSRIPEITDIDPPPASSAPAPAGGSSGAPRLQINVGTACPQEPVSIGTVVTITFGTGFLTEAEARASYDAANTTLSINGDFVPVERIFDPGPYDPPGPNGVLWGYYSFATWRPSVAGTYSIVAVDQNETETCLVTVQ